jgi:Domain of unknown function (DUF4350)
LTGRRLLIGAVAAIVAVNVVLWGLHRLSGGSPGGPASSSYATGSDGDAAWASLLLRAGHRVARLRVRPSAAALAPGSTAIVLDPPVVLVPDTEALAAFVRGGGRLIAGGTDVSWLRRIVGGRLKAATDGVEHASPLAPVAEVAGVTRVDTAGSGSWTRLGGALPILGDGTRAIAAVAAVGRGSVVLLADDSPLQNGHLGTADDARFALDIAGPAARNVVFFETYHGYGSSSGIAAIPARWRALIVLAALATGLYLLARGRRLGPPELERRELDPPRREYVEALGGILARTHAPGAALAPLQAEARRRLERAQAGPLETPGALLAAARARGLPEDEAAAVARDGVRSEDVLPLGRALARLGGSTGGQRWRGSETG